MLRFNKTCCGPRTIGYFTKRPAAAGISTLFPSYFVPVTSSYPGIKLNHPPRKIDEELFDSLISHFDKLIKASVDRYGKSE
jgi:hypothetical protein